MKRLVAGLLAGLMALSLCGCKKSETVLAAEKAIKAIGEVTIDSLDEIQAAEKAVEALTAEEKEKFKMLDELEAAKEKYDEAVLNAEVDKVVEAIDKISTVSLETVGQIVEAQKLYDGLSEEGKKKVSNYNKLTAAQTEAKSLKEARANELLATMRLDEDRVRQLKFYYPGTMSFYDANTWAADIRCFVLPYIGSDGQSTWLRLLCNYTEDDWVFFESIIFAVDGNNYTEYFSYSDVVRDNGGGDVWEYVDMEVNESELAMLKAIANSNETIVRFQGDEYSHDFIISESDKQAIAQVVEVYELLQ